MGQLLMTAVGAVGGFLLGGPFGASIGATLGGMVGSTLFAPTIKGPRLQDLTVSASTYGNAIPKGYGTARMSSNMIWTAGIKEKKTKKKVGKGGGQKQTVYTYSASFAVAFCQGEADDVLRIWGDSKLIYDGSVPAKAKFTWPPTQEFIREMLLRVFGKGNKKKKYKFRVYKGTEDQLPDSIMEAKEGAGNVPGYRGLVYIVFENMPLEDFGNRIPQISAEISFATSKEVVSLGVQNLIGTSSTYQTDEFAVDWEGQRGYLVRGGEVVAYDLATMRGIGRKRGTEITREAGFWGTSGVHQIAAAKGGYGLLGATSNDNSRPNVFFTPTLVGVDIYGGDGNSLGIKLFDDCILTGGNRYDPIIEPLGMAVAVRNYGSFFPEVFWVCSTVFGKQYILRRKPAPNTTEKLIWRDTEGGLFDNTVPVIPGLEGVEFSSAFYYYTHEGEIKLEEMIISAWASGNVLPFQRDYCMEASVPLYFESGGVERNDHYISAAMLGMSGTLSSECAVYDPTDNGVVIQALINDNGVTDTVIFKYIVDFGFVKWVTRLSGNQTVFSHRRVGDSRIVGGEFGWAASNGTIWVISLTNGDVTFQKDHFSTAVTQYQSWDDVSKSLVIQGYGDGIGRYFIRNSPAGTLNLGDIVGDLCNRSNLSPEDYDVSDLNDISVKGYVVSRQAPVKDCIGQLASAYFFDGVESDYKLKFQKRGGDSVASITEDDLGWVEERSLAWRETRGQELELPMRVSINYMDVERDYQVGSQHHKRIANPFPSMYSHAESSAELPIVLTASEAKQIAEKTINAAWVGRDRYESVLGWKYLHLDPADVVDVTLDSGSVFKVRFDQMDIGLDYSIKVQAIADDAASYVSTAVAHGGDQIPIYEVGDPAPMKVFVVNSALLRDTDDRSAGNMSVFYVAAAPLYADTFGGAVVTQSINGGEDEVVAYLESEAVWGTATSVLPDRPDIYALDEETVLTVNLSNPEHTLESVSYEQLMEGANAALVGKEVVQFRDALLLDDGTWELRGLLRGRRGTDWAVPNHERAEDFVLLDPADFSIVTTPIATVAETRIFKAMAPGTLTEDATPTSVQIESKDVLSYAPVVYQIVDDGESFGIEVLRQVRVRGELRAGTGLVPIDPFELDRSVDLNGALRFDTTVYVGQDIDTVQGTQWVDDPNSVAIVTTDSTYSTDDKVFVDLTDHKAAIDAVGFFTVRVSQVGQYGPGYPRLVQFSKQNGLWSRRDS